MLNTVLILTHLNSKLSYKIGIMMITFYKQGNEGTKNLNDVPKVIDLQSDRGRIRNLGSPTEGRELLDTTQYLILSPNLSNIYIKCFTLKVFEVCLLLRWGQNLVLPFNDVTDHSVNTDRPLNVSFSFTGNVRN